jgi:hypothetical protein
MKLAGYIYAPEPMELMQRTCELIHIESLAEDRSEVAEYSLSLGRIIPMGTC